MFDWSQVGNPNLPKTFWWPLIAKGDKAIDCAKLEAEFAAEEAKELKVKKKEEVRAKRCDSISTAVVTILLTCS